MENEAQLATLLSHEMTHSTHRHTVENFRSIKNKTAVLATFQVTVGGLGGGIGELVDILGTVGTMAAITGYSRQLESEADSEGFKGMVEAGYDPREAPKLFIHLKEEVEAEDIKEPFFFGTHPRLQKRIDNYERLIKTNYPTYNQGIKNIEIFQEKICPLLLENARLDLKIGRFKWAQEGVEKYLSLRPNDATAYYVLGEILRQEGKEGDRKTAIEHYKKSLSIEPSYPDPHKRLGLIYYKQGEKSLAKKHFETYLSLSSNGSDRTYIEYYIKQLE